MKQDLQAVIFDMDGVILDSERTLLEEWKVIARELGLRKIERVYISVCGTTMETTERIVKEAYGQDFPFKELTQRAYAMLEQKYKNGLPLKTGIRELLSALKEHGIRIALASSTERTQVIRHLETAGLLSFFDVLVTGDMVTRSKPDPEIFLKAIELLNVPASSCVIIEDSFNGVRAGRRSSAEVIMVPDLKAPNEEIAGEYDKIFPDLNEVREYLLQ